MKDPRNPSILKPQVAPEATRPRARLPGRHAKTRSQPPSSGIGMRHLVPRLARGGGPKIGLPVYRAGHSAWWASSLYQRSASDAQPALWPQNDPANEAHVASTATPGQAGLPAEFKHINKRRRRNLQGFP